MTTPNYREQAEALKQEVCPHNHPSTYSTECTLCLASWASRITEERDAALRGKLVGYEPDGDGTLLTVLVPGRPAAQMSMAIDVVLAPGARVSGGGAT